MFFIKTPTVLFFKSFPRVSFLFTFLVLNFLRLRFDFFSNDSFTDFSTKFAAVDKISKETLEPIVNDLIKSNDTNFKGVGQPLRIALTGSKFGPGIYDIIISLGKEEVTKRLTNKIIV